MKHFQILNNKKKEANNTHQPLNVYISLQI